MIWGREPQDWGKSLLRSVSGPNLLSVHRAALKVRPQGCLRGISAAAWFLAHPDEGPCCLPVRPWHDWPAADLGAYQAPNPSGRCCKVNAVPRKSLQHTRAEPVTAGRGEGENCQGPDRLTTLTLSRDGNRVPLFIRNTCRW